MKYSQHIIFAACLSVLQLCPLHGDILPLRINNILGEHVIAEGVIVEIYTTTKTKAEIYYSITIDGINRGGNILTNITGVDSTFWWDTQGKKLWVINKNLVTVDDYSNPDNHLHHGIIIANIQTLNPPHEVLEIAAEITKK